nr:hypothetical protein [uncultured Flavobacterium sp.]
MIDNNLDYKWLKVKNGKPFFAVINLEIVQTDSENEIIEAYCGKGFTSQGVLESVPEKGYDHWKIAVKTGLEFAFSLTDSFWKVRINSLEGRIFMDTNPTIVAYTAILAFCEQTQTNLDSELKERLENFVFSSWDKGNENLQPNFKNLEFEKDDAAVSNGNKTSI